MIRKTGIVSVVLFCGILYGNAPAFAASGNCYGSLKNDTLYIGNQCVERTFLWNGGNLKTLRLENKLSGWCENTYSNQPDFIITRNTDAASNGKLSTEWVKETVINPAFLKVTVSFSLGELDVQRVYRVYDNCPVIGCDTYLRGAVNSVFGEKQGNVADNKNIESTKDMKSSQVTAILDRFAFKGQHWHTKTVEFTDVTDWNNNLVWSRDFIPYRKLSYRGNILFAENGESKSGFFVLKEAPCSGVQLAYKGADFIAEFGHFMVTGIGITEKDISPEKWTRTYSCVLGVYDGTELDALKVLRKYQKNVRILTKGRDEMVMMNTWGDRSQDTKVNEEFCLSEIEKAARLGFTHFQIDDGWQVGKSPNSALAKGSFKNIWDNPDYWKPDPKKYPHGLKPIVEKGRKFGVEVCLWFNPSVQNDFAEWEKDAQAITELYRKYGIRVFKIDGVNIPTKRAEENLRCLFEKVWENTNYAVVFNLDVTAGRRGGYHLFNEYGNIFLENRYTDWGNYYPYWTLRNLWMLSKYVPTEKLQIEFLNKWRNSDKYGDDIFAPSHYSFDYLFAISMAGQPLAWMEAANLPEEAYGLSNLVETYKDISYDFHSGIILPVGEEPSGTSWTGFQSLKENGEGYLLFFRENNESKTGKIQTWLNEGERIECTLLLGVGETKDFIVGPKGTLDVELPQKNSFVMYKYKIRK